jgi:hypothetical protein
MKYKPMKPRKLLQNNICRQKVLREKIVKPVDPITLLSEVTLIEVWDNPSDDCYNEV